MIKSDFRISLNFENHKHMQFRIINMNIYSKPWSRSYYQKMWKFFAAVDNILDIKRFIASIEINEACK